MRFRLPHAGLLSQANFSWALDMLKLSDLIPKALATLWMLRKRHD